jgi:hypothetical protein
MGEYPQRWRSPLADAVRAREGLGLTHPGGTPKCPRRPDKQYPGGRALPPQPQLHYGRQARDRRCGARGRGAPPETRELIRAGYYDELRRAFHDAAE